MRIILDTDNENNFIDLWNPEKTRWERCVKIINKDENVLEKDKKIEKLVGVYKGVYIDYSMRDIVGKINEIIDKINKDSDKE